VNLPTESVQGIGSVTYTIHTIHTAGTSGFASITGCLDQSKLALGGQTTPVTVSAKWTATWAINGKNQGSIPTQPPPVTDIKKIRVDEVQTLVTGAR